MKAIIFLTVILACTLARRSKEGPADNSLKCDLSSKHSKISCSSNQYIKVQSANYGPITDDSSCPISVDGACAIDILDQVQKACDFKGECMILKEHYDLFQYDCPNQAAELAVSYTCEEESNVASSLWDAFNQKRKENNLQAAEWNQEYVDTARTELDTRLGIKGGFSSYPIFHKHERLDGVANEQKDKTPEGIRYMMEFVAKLSTSIYPAKTAVTEWVNSADENDYKNMLYEYDLGGAACDNYGNGWVCVLHAVKLM